MILEGLEGVLCLVDDVLVFGSDQQEHDRRLRGVLERLNKARVTLNAEKCAFSRKEIKFLGHVVNHRGVHPDPDKTTAIQMMPKPKDVSELRRFLGMINQFNKFSPRIADLTQPLRELLSARNVWQWSPKHDLAFAALKQVITKPSTLALYNPQVATKISTDASSYGLGAVLLQEEQGSWKPVAFASKALTETEQRYAQIEKEALAIVWACNKFSTFILGLHFEIETDHKPLVPLLSTKHLDTLPPRILRFRLQMARYDYAIHHSPGKSLLTADTLSRAPHNMDQPGEDTPTTDSDVEAFVNALVSFTPITSPALNRYRIEQRRDPVCTSLSTFCREGWPNKQMLPESLKAYWFVRNELSIGDGLLLFGCRIIVPSSLQTMTLQKLHEGHLGIQRCRLRAKMAVWWPGLNKQICRIIQNCQVCTKRNQPHTEPMLSPTLPMYPWQKVSSDLFTLKGRNYLLIVDSFSRFPEVVQLSSTSSQTVIGILKSVFAQFGIPEILVTDNGPQYASKHMAEFAKSYGFQHTTSSPYYPQGNGQAERTVKTVKTLIQNADDPFLALLNYRATPLPWCNLSPAELLFGRRIRTTIPQLPCQMVPSWPYLQKFRTSDEEAKQRQKENYDLRHGVKPLPELEHGTEVWVTNRGKRGTITSKTNTPRSYIINTPEGTIRRNRRHLIAVPRASTHCAENNPGDDENHFHYDGDTPKVKEELRDNMQREQLSEPVITEEHEDENQHLSKLRSPILTRTRTGNTLKPPDRFGWNS